MKKTIRRAEFFGALIALLGAGELAAESVDVRIGAPEVRPGTIVKDTRTPITVSSSITDPDLIPGSVKLKVAGMPDIDMTATPGSPVYSATVSLTIPLGSTAAVRVGASFRGTAGQAVSSDAAVAAVTNYISDFSKTGLEGFMRDNSINSAAAFLQHLKPSDFTDWILMTGTASLQVGTAASPRVIVQSDTSDKVFGFGLTDGVQPGQLKKNVVEFIQWDSSKNLFRFHTIDTGSQQVTEDDGSCASCHSSGGKRDPGITWPYPRPNWDAYDSWGGAMPFNRDRIYNSTVESTYMIKLLSNPTDPILSQLQLPMGMTRDGTGKLIIDFGIAGIDSPDTVVDRPVLYKQDAATPLTQLGGLTYPKFNPATETPSVTVRQGASFFLMRNSFSSGLQRTDPNYPAPKTVGAVQIPATNWIGDGGRGVAMFDHFSAFNAQRVAQELVDSVGKTKSSSSGKQVDIRPVALGIALNCVVAPTPANLQKFASAAVITALLKKLGAADFTVLLADTETKQQKLPQLKANQEAPNVAGLLEFVQAGSSNADNITRQVARRSKQHDYFRLDALTGFMIDREGNPDGTVDPEATRMIALFRLFLEPVGEPVSKWEMSIRGSLASGLIHTTYTFADQFRATYVPVIKSRLLAALGYAAGTADGDATVCADLQDKSDKAFKNY